MKFRLCHQVVLSRALTTYRNKVNIFVGAQRTKTIILKINLKLNLSTTTLLSLYYIICKCAQHAVKYSSLPVTGRRATCSAGLARTCRRCKCRGRWSRGPWSVRPWRRCRPCWSPALWGVRPPTPCWGEAVTSCSCDPTSPSVSSQLPWNIHHACKSRGTSWSAGFST